MADINWPTGPTTGRQYTSPNGQTWNWNGYAWDAIAFVNRDRYVIYDFSHGDIKPSDKLVEAVMLITIATVAGDTWDKFSKKKEE